MQIVIMFFPIVGLVKKIKTTVQQQVETKESFSDIDDKKAFDYWRSGIISSKNFARYARFRGAKTLTRDWGKDGTLHLGFKDTKNFFLKDQMGTYNIYTQDKEGRDMIDELVLELVNLGIHVERPRNGYNAPKDQQRKFGR